MGQRTVKRVPLDFDWPLKQVWKGYEPPEWRPCPAGPNCIHGSTPAGEWLTQLVNLLLIAGEYGATQERPLHPWLRQFPLAPEQPPGADMAELTAGLAGRPPRGRMGHDALDRWATWRKIRDAAGMGEDWGICPACKGHAMHPDDQVASEAWKGYGPPAGDGWQLWETTSDGSPVSPVFETPEALAGWCAEHATLFAGYGASYDEWLSMIRADEVDIGSTMAFRGPA